MRRSYFLFLIWVVFLLYLVFSNQNETGKLNNIEGVKRNILEKRLNAKIKEIDVEIVNSDYINQNITFQSPEIKEHSEAYIIKLSEKGDVEYMILAKPYYYPKTIGGEAKRVRSTVIGRKGDFNLDYLRGTHKALLIIY